MICVLMAFTISFSIVSFPFISVFSSSRSLSLLLSLLFVYLFILDLPMLKELDVYRFACMGDMDKSRMVRTKKGLSYKNTLTMKCRSVICWIDK